jgi:uncharacterized protein (UPF0333 family)
MAAEHKMTNKIQLRRDTTANWTRVNPILDDGEPGLDITTNKIKYGDGSTAWNDLAYASGGGLPESEGVVTFPGNFLIGSLHPDNPYTGPSGPSGDKESVVWAKDDSEYLGLWWGGDQTYPDSGYGPVAGIMIGYGEGATDDFVNFAAPEGTAITLAINGANDTLSWVFNYDGSLTFPNNNTLHTKGHLTVQTSGIPDAITAITTSSGSWNGVSGVNISTTGGTGSGLFVDVDHDGSGIANFVSIVTPGNGYTDGDTITATRDGASVQFTISVPAKNWTFNSDGSLAFPTGGKIGPGGIKGEGTTLAGQNGHFVSLTSNYDSGMYSSCVTANADGTLTITNYGDGTGAAGQWTFSKNGQMNIKSSDTTDSGTGFAGIFKLTNNNVGATNINKSIRIKDNGNLQIIDSSYSNTIFDLSDSGDLTLKGSLLSEAGTGPVAIQSNDNSNTFTWNFNSNGSLSLPSLINAQGNGNLDATNNVFTLGNGGQVDFHNFSGMILVNSHYGGNVTLYLCGGGAGDAVAIGTSKGSALGSMAFNSGIGGYTFTASEAGDHVFFVVRTRTGG